MGSETVRQPLGRKKLRASGVAAELVSINAHAPLLVCIHGGGCNSRYFDVPSFSFMEAAVARGYNVLLVDRIGHGDSDCPAGPGALSQTVTAIPALVAQVQALMNPAVPVALVGHSIGGAVAFEAAANHQLELFALVISGLGAQPTKDSLDWQSSSRVVVDPPSEFFFGPERSYSWRAPLLLRNIAEPWKHEEISDILLEWPSRFARLAERLRVPVHLRLSENERIWMAQVEDLAFIRKCLKNACPSDVGLLEGGGHLYELHKAGPAHIQGQLDFLDAALAKET